LADDKKVVKIPIGHHHLKLKPDSLVQTSQIYRLEILKFKKSIHIFVGTLCALMGQGEVGVLIKVKQFLHPVITNPTHIVNGFVLLVLIKDVT